MVVKVKVEGVPAMGRAAGTDILEASARALVNALNRASLAGVTAAP